MTRGKVKAMYIQRYTFYIVDFKMFDVRAKYRLRPLDNSSDSFR